MEASLRDSVASDADGDGGRRYFAATSRLQDQVMSQFLATTEQNCINEVRGMISSDATPVVIGLATWLRRLRR